MHQRSARLISFLFLALFALTATVANAEAAGAAPAEDAWVASFKACSAGDAAIQAVKKSVGAPGDFCRWWDPAHKKHAFGPISGMTARSLNRACLCIQKNPSLIGPTKTHAVYKPTATSSVEGLNSLRKAILAPLPFCKWWLRSTKRSSSPFFELGPQQVTKVCSQVVANPSLVSTKPTPSGKTRSTEAAKTSSSSTRTRLATTSSDQKSGKTSKTTQSSSSSSLTSSATSINPTTATTTIVSSSSSINPNSTAGTTSEASKVVLKPAETAVLTAMPPPGTDLTDLSNLTPSKNASLYFAGAPADNSSAGTAAALDMKFAYPSVVLDHTVFITSVSCSDSVMNIQYNNKAAYVHASDEWKKDPKVILITASDSCGLNASSTVFLSSDFAFDDAGMAAKVKGKITDMASVYATVALDFGAVDMSNVTYVPPTCGSLPANITLNFPTSACGSNFDTDLDLKLGYYSGKDEDQASVLSIIAPSNSTSSGLSKRGFSFKSIVKAVSSPIQSVAKTVASTAAKVLPASVNNAIKSVTNVVSSGIAAVKSLVPPLNYSKTIPLSVDIGPAKNDPSPWGNQFKFFSWSPSDPSTIAASQQKLDAVKSQLTGVSNPKPGIDMFCVNCGIKGELTAVGSISASLTSGVTTCSIGLSGNMYAGVYIGVNAFANYQKTYNKDLISKGLPSFSIPGIVTVGPKITVSVQSTLNVAAEGQLLVGASLNWPNIKANLDLLDKSKSYQSGFVPVIDKKFQAYGDLSASASLGLPMELFFGIELLGGTIKKGVSLVDTPMVTASALLNVNANFGSGQSNSVTSNNGCLGIKYNVGAKNDLSMNVLGLSQIALSHWENPALVAGCIGKKVATVTTTTTTTTTTDDPTPDPTTDATTDPTDDPTGTSSSPDSTSTDTSTTTDAGNPGDGSGGSGDQASSTSAADANPTSTPDDGSSNSGGSNPSTTDSGTGSGSGSGSGSGAGSGSGPTSVSTGTITTMASAITSSATTIVASPTPNPNAPRCGDVYNTLDGRTWQIKCNIDYPGQDITHKPFSNITACIDYCNDYGSACKGVIWVQRGLDAQQCFLKSSIATNGTVASGLTAFSAAPVTYSPLRSCPSADGQAFLDTQNQVYQIKCATDYSGYDLGSYSGYTTMESCINYCDSDPDCVGVSYAYTGTYKSPVCYPKYKMTSSPLNSTVYKYKMDSAVKITKPVYASLGSCPSVDGTNFYDKQGNTYRISCGLTFDDNDITQRDGMQSLEACINACDSTSTCVGVSYAYDGYYGNNPGCFLKNAQNPTPRNSSAFSFTVDSAFLVSTRFTRRKVRRGEVKSVTASTKSTVTSANSSSSRSSSSITAATPATTKSSTTTTSSYSKSTSSATTSSHTAHGTEQPHILADVTLNVTITDATKSFQLLPGNDGSVYLSTNYSANNAVKNFVYEDGIITADVQERFFLYFPDLMNTYGASRFRLAPWGKIPIGARLLTMMPLQVTGQTVLVATDTLGNIFFPIACSYDGNANLKVFLVKDNTGDLSFMTDPTLRFVMTGGVVAECNPLSLTADGISTLATTPTDTGDGSNGSSTG